MVSVGQPLVQLSDRPLTNVSPAVLLTISIADAHLVGVARGPWGVSRLVFVMAVVVAIQLVVIVWLSGMLLGMLAAARFISLASSEGYLASIDSMMIRCAAEALPALFATMSGRTPFLTVNVEPPRV